jgi:hypothetical protein
LISSATPIASKTSHATPAASANQTITRSDRFSGLGVWAMTVSDTSEATDTRIVRRPNASLIFDSWDSKYERRNNQHPRLWAVRFRLLQLELSAQASVANKLVEYDNANNHCHNSVERRATIPAPLPPPVRSQPGQLDILVEDRDGFLCATKNQPPPKLIIEFHIKPMADAGNSTLANRCQRLRR